MDRSPIENLLTALGDALERGTASLDTDRTFTVRVDEVTTTGGVNIEPVSYAVTIDGPTARLTVNDVDAFRLTVRDRLTLWRWRHRTRRRYRRANTAALADIARTIAPPSL
jgi:hypothetical protein